MLNEIAAAVSLTFAAAATATLAAASIAYQHARHRATNPDGSAAPADRAQRTARHQRSQWTHALRDAALPTAGCWAMTATVLLLPNWPFLALLWIAAIALGYIAAQTWYLAALVWWPHRTAYAGACAIAGLTTASPATLLLAALLNDGTVASITVLPG